MECSIPVSALLAPPFYLERERSFVQVRIITTHFTGGSEDPVISKQNIIIPELQEEKDTKPEDDDVYKSIFDNSELLDDLDLPKAPTILINGKLLTINWPSYESFGIGERDTYTVLVEKKDSSFEEVLCDNAE